MATALAVAAIIAQGGGAQIAASATAALAVSLAALAGTLAAVGAGYLVAYWLLGPSRRMPWPKEEKPAGPPCFPAIGARGGTAPMDVIGAEVDQMLGGSDQDA